MDKIVKSFQINAKDKILELGAGRGKISFWLSFFLKCQITAIDQIPSFVKIANFFIKTARLKNIKFLCEDYFNYDFNNFNVIYLYGTTLTNEQINTLIKKFKIISSSVKIITVSYSLSEYDNSFVCIKDLDVSFPWGKTKVYLNVKRNQINAF